MRGFKFTATARNRDGECEEFNVRASFLSSSRLPLRRRVFSAHLFWVFVVALIFAMERSFAGNIDLSTVPARDSVQLTIYNSEDITLVRETRKIVFKKGVNPLQFSWANTLIDPTSVELKFLTNPQQLEVLDTTFPRDKPQMLYWNVQSDFEGEAAVQITYFTSGITWSADYTAIASSDEKKLHLDGFVKVSNRSGEEYENAQVRLVVGKINLVEKIAELAQIPVSKVAALSRNRRLDIEHDAFQQAADGQALGFAGFGGGGASGGEMIPRPKEIAKEGVSEYFIYTIEGTETITDGWSKRLRSIEAADIPLKIQYRYRPQEYGDQLARMYLMTNDKDSKLGTTPLPDGNVRVFRDNGRDGLSYLTCQAIKYIAIGDKIELNLGVDPRVIFELIKLRVSRDNIWMQLHGADLYGRVDDGADKIEINSAVAGWDEHAVFTQRIRNYTPAPIDVEIRRSFDGDVTFRSSLNPVLHDYRTVQSEATVEAGKKADLIFETVTRQGHNARQGNVTLEAAAVKP